MKPTSKFKNYVKSTVQPMRPFVPGEDMTGISIEKGLKPVVGGKIARSVTKPKDQWYISPSFMKANYELAVDDTPKTLDTTSAKDGDFVYGDSDTFKLICKVSSKAEKWMKSTKAMQVRNAGCVVQVTTQQGEHIAEALTFVPGAKIVERVVDGIVVSRKLQA